MLTHDSNTAITTATSTTQAVNCDLLTGTLALIDELKQRLDSGEAINNPALTEMADRVFGGTRAQGTYTPRDAYDVVETTVNKLLLEGRAERLMQMSVTDALARFALFGKSLTPPIGPDL